MAATTDIRLDRIKHEYEGVRNAQDALFDKVDSFEAALLGLTEAVAENRERLERVEGVVAENQRQIAELNDKMDRLMKHLDVPPKPPAGFVRE
ncbi:MAG: hypothetical protein OXI30_08095 [Chloroflexota bacterium]|nr:hypothetical protein [Chloroflexota bacterium]MDE2636312.1 hypothetical protein [Chloroflexota bacterium]MYE27068.1 hypothetical protein [Chloroflexota bacterium]